MASLCARSEQCEYDVRQKLFKLGLPPHDINETIEYLVSNKFISNDRFAKASPTTNADSHPAEIR